MGHLWIARGDVESKGFEQEIGEEIFLGGDASSDVSGGGLVVHTVLVLEAGR